MTIEEKEIIEIVNRETNAWDTQDIGLLLSIFHCDMVWPWPTKNSSHNPIEWEFVMGRFDYDRWKRIWQTMFDTHKLLKNIRTIQKVEISAEKDGGFAVVDIDTLWVHTITGDKNHWFGRTCKVYTKVKGDWKLIMHTGALEYPNQENFGSRD